MRPTRLVSGNTSYDPRAFASAGACNLRAALFTASPVRTPFGSSFGSVRPTRMPDWVSTFHHGMPRRNSLPNLLPGLYASSNGEAMNVEYHDTHPPFDAPSSDRSAAAAALMNTSPVRTLALISEASSVDPPPKPRKP